MKNSISISIILFLFLITVTSCKKEEKKGRVFGRVLEYGTNRPIADADVELYTCTFFEGQSSCTLSQIIKSDSEGRYEVEYEPASGSLTAKAEGYFDGGELVLDPSQNYEQDFILDPFAWLSVRVVNEMPAEEFDKIRLTFNPGGGGWKELISALFIF